MFRKMLIANRGEIACRIIKTARRMGIATVSVYSQVDASAQHVALADEAVEIGPASARDSYLRVERILQAASETGADAIHPGYGFLSENADFADACRQAGIVFVGPPAEAIRNMGAKTTAKVIMTNAGVPVVPGYHGEDQSADCLASQAREIGYPVLLKASAGGGGKGMRIVETSHDLDGALAAARREATSAFGDDTMLVEKYLSTPRHVEVQVFADTHGNFVYLFERDCSVQRRYQKIIEEAPAPGMDAERRAAMGKVAVDAARAVNYVGAGTVEFIVDTDGEFYFMEMNTRLQVEHPVTEMITNQDLVEWQLRVAAGESLPVTQDQLLISGHAFEVRVYAEDPDREFLPSTGRLAHLRFPFEDKHVRVDTGVREGDSIDVHYDPLIAKIVIWDRNRDEALQRMHQALRDTHIVGVTTNLQFVSRVLSHHSFADGEIDTGFIERHRDSLMKPNPAATGIVFAIAALSVLLHRAVAAACSAATSTDPYSPWHDTAAWRLGQVHVEKLQFVEQGLERAVQVHHGETDYRVETGDEVIRISGTFDANGDLLATADGKRVRATVVQVDGDLTVFCQGKRFALNFVDGRRTRADSDSNLGGLIAPMPGKIIGVFVEQGQEVEKGAPLLIIEAMKMEHAITAPNDGKVTAINFKDGDMVEEGAELLVVA